MSPDDIRSLFWQHCEAFDFGKQRQWQVSSVRALFPMRRPLNEPAGSKTITFERDDEDRIVCGDIVLIEHWREPEESQAKRDRADAERKRQQRYNATHRAKRQQEALA